MFNPIIKVYLPKFPVKSKKEIPEVETEQQYDEDGIPILPAELPPVPEQPPAPKQIVTLTKTDVLGVGIKVARKTGEDTEESIYIDIDCRDFDNPVHQLWVYWRERELRIEPLFASYSIDSYVGKKASRGDFLATLVVVDGSVTLHFMSEDKYEYHIEGEYAADFDREDYPVPEGSHSYPDLVSELLPLYKELYSKHRVKGKFVANVDVHNSLAYLEAQVDTLTKAVMFLLPAGHPLYPILEEADSNSTLQVDSSDKTMSKVFGLKKEFRMKQERYRQEKAQNQIQDKPLILPPPPTQEQIIKRARDEFDLFINSYLDAWAQSRGYDGIGTLVQYDLPSEPNEKWRREGRQGVIMKSQIWAKCYEIMTAVLAGQRDIPTQEELLAELPPLTWGDEENG